MPRYLLFRAVKERSEEDVEAAALRSIEAMNQMPGVRWIRSYWSVEEGGFYCEYEAPSAELLFEHARRARLTLERVEVVRDLEPSMFR
jgi:Nickel responsive protein SCO4226-like